MMDEREVKALLFCLTPLFGGGMLATFAWLLSMKGVL